MPVLESPREVDMSEAGRTRRAEAGRRVAEARLREAEEKTREAEERVREIETMFVVSERRLKETEAALQRAQTGESELQECVQLRDSFHGHVLGQEREALMRVKAEKEQQQQELGEARAEVEEKTQAVAELERAKECPVCLDHPCNASFLCGHGVCSQCAPTLTACPVCRVERGYIKRFA
jgi:DNA repair exonuclease SbcCD ATPase subunit